MQLTAMTYNICSGKNLQRERDLAYAASVIREIGPDFVTLNEVRSRTSDIGDIDQASELARLTGYYPVFGKSIDILGGAYGNAVLTRLPLAEWNVIHIPDPAIRGEGYYEHRTLLRCVLLAGEKPLTVFSTHFGLMPDEQELAVRTAVEAVRAEANPVLLMGDLNLPPDAPALAPLMSVLCDSAVGAAVPLTFPSDVPEVKIDYILHSRGVAVHALRSMDTQCSDHRPLIADVML